MAITRSQAWYGQMRVDVPHLRSLDSAVCYDFDVLAGQIMGGRKPLIVKGFTINVNGTVGADPTTLTMSVAGGLIMHYGASESGSIFAVGDDVAAETLDASNSNVLGGFTANTINYIGLDLLRAADDSTADSVQFLDSNTLLEVTQTVDLARTLQYKIVISTQNFSVSSNILPVAKVITNATNGITSITDARPMLFRLGSGGDSVNALSTYSWGTRLENSVTYTGTTDPFTAEDKNINDLKSWIDAIMTSLWEVRGGDYWYSKSVRDNVKLIYTSSVLTYNADNFALQVFTSTAGNIARAVGVVTVTTSAPYTFVNGQTVYVEASSPAEEALFPSGPKVITVTGAATFTYVEAGTQPVASGQGHKVSSCTWKGLKLIFENTAAYWYNTIQNNDETAGIGLLDNQCIYVDLVRSSNATVIPVVASIPDVGTSVIPGRRFILAWRIGDLLYTRDRAYEADRAWGTLATVAVSGKVILSRATVASPPAVISLQGGTITPPDNTVGLNVAAAAAGNNNAITATGTGTGKGGIFISGGSGGTAYGVQGVNTGSNAPAVYGTNTFAAGWGIAGVATVGAGIGALGQGGATGAGVLGITVGGGAGALAGLAGQGGVFQGEPGAPGLKSWGNGAGAGGVFVASATAGCIAVDASGTNASGIGVKGVSTVNGGKFESTGNTVSTGALYAEATGGANPAAIWAKAFAAGSTAVHAERGHITVEDTSSRFQYNTPRTRIFIADASMMVADGTTNVLYSVASSSGMPYLINAVAGGVTIAATVRIPLPKGALITDVKVSANNVAAGNKNLNCFIRRFDKSATQFAAAVYGNLNGGAGDAVTFIPGSTWGTIPLSADTAKLTSTEDGLYTIFIAWDALLAPSEMQLYAVRVTYTCQEVSGVQY